METFSNNLRAELHIQLADLATKSDNMLQLAQESFRRSCDTMDLLKAQASQIGFRDHDEEIRFFKEWWPTFYKEILYWKEIAEIELGKSLWKRDNAKQYRTQQQHFYCQFFRRHRYLYQYHLSKRTDQDPKFFIHNKDNGLLFHHSLGQTINTPEASYVLAHFLAYTEVLHYLDSAKNKRARQMQNVLQWTGSKAQFIELVYAIHASGAVNAGSIDMKGLFKILSSLFGLEVTNYYSYFNAMSIRKKDRTPFLNHITKQLLLRMDEGIGLP